MINTHRIHAKERERERGHMQQSGWTMRWSQQVLAVLCWCSWPTVSDLMETWGGLPALSCPTVDQPALWASADCHTTSAQLCSLSAICQQVCQSDATSAQSPHTEWTISTHCIEWTWCWWPTFYRVPGKDLNVWKIKYQCYWHHTEYEVFSFPWHILSFAALLLSYCRSCTLHTNLGSISTSENLHGCQRIRISGHALQRFWKLTLVAPSPAPRTLLELSCEIHSANTNPLSDRALLFQPNLTHCWRVTVCFLYIWLGLFKLQLIIPWRVRTMPSRSWVWLGMPLIGLDYCNLQ